MPTLHVAHSPDSDDAFMFWALAAEKIDTEDRRYIHELADIETLNQRAMKGELEITAVSFHAYSHLADTYALLPHGGSPRGPRPEAHPLSPRCLAAYGSGSFPWGAVWRQVTRIHQLVLQLTPPSLDARLPQPRCLRGRA